MRLLQKSEPGGEQAGPPGAINSLNSIPLFLLISLTALHLF